MKQGTQSVSETGAPVDSDHCPECGGETTFGFGLAGGGVEDEAGQTVPGVYFMCLDCDWMSCRPKQTICFPHGLVHEGSE